VDSASKSVMDQKKPTDAPDAAGDRRDATRFALQMPMRVRALAVAAWFEARTENVGRSGVFFRHERTTGDEIALQVGTPVEMILSLPVELGGGSSATTTCRGRIVRIEQSDPSDRGEGIAATIDSFQMAHGYPKTL
jgi:hypothetical protein